MSPIGSFSFRGDGFKKVSATHFTIKHDRSPGICAHASLHRRVPASAPASQGRRDASLLGFPLSSSKWRRPRFLSSAAKASPKSSSASYSSGWRTPRSAPSWLKHEPPRCAHRTTRGIISDAPSSTPAPAARRRGGVAPAMLRTDLPIVCVRSCVRVPAACVQAEAALARLLQGQTPRPRDTARSPSEIHAQHLTSARGSPHSHSVGSFAGLLQPTPRPLGHGPPSLAFQRAGPASPASLSPGIVRPPVSPNRGARAVVAAGEMRPASQGSARRRAHATAVSTPRPQQAAQPYHLSAEAFLKNVTEQRVEQHFSPASQRPPTFSPPSQRPPTSSPPSQRPPTFSPLSQRPPTFSPPSQRPPTSPQTSPSRKLDSRHMTGDGAGLSSTGLIYEVRGSTTPALPRTRTTHSVHQPCT